MRTFNKYQINAKGTQAYPTKRKIMDTSEQQFLRELDDKLWKAADKLRSNLDAANYKHVVLGLIFLKYVSDAFEERRNELEMLFQQNSDNNIYFMPREDYDSDQDYQQAINDELELLDYYQEKPWMNSSGSRAIKPA